MKRRLFVGKAIVGLSLPFVPNALLAATSVTSQPIDITIDQINRSIRKGSLGSIQRLTISHLYNPDQIDWTTLLTYAQKDISLVAQLINSPLAIDLPTAPQATFGSGSTQLIIDDMIVTWEGLAHKSRQPSGCIGQFRITGSAGILNGYLDGSSYQLVDLRGKVIKAKGQSHLTAQLSTVRHRFITPA